jgi:hypothetical protein
MSDSGSEPFVENDEKQTEIPFDKGGVPLYVSILWVGFIISYVVVMSLLALPDLRAWIAR